MDYQVNGLNYAGMCFDGSEKYPNFYFRNRALCDSALFVGVMAIVAALVHAVA